VLLPEEEAELEEAGNVARTEYAHGRDRRIIIGTALNVIHRLWGKIDPGKFKREIKDFTNIPYNTARDYRAEASATSRTDFVLVDSEEHDDESEFDTGEEQDDPHAERMSCLQAEEKARAKSRGRSTIMVTVSKVPVEDRARFTDWKKDHKWLLETLMRQVVACILDIHIGPHHLMDAIRDLQVTTADVASSVTGAAVLVSDAVPVEEAPVEKGKKLTFTDDDGDDL
jgi:hypothetical protein